MNLSSSSSRGSFSIRNELKIGITNECVPSTSTTITNDTIDNRITTCDLPFISFPATAATADYQKHQSTPTFSKSDYSIFSSSNGVTNSKLQLQQSIILPSRALQSTSSNSSPSFFLPLIMPTSTCTTQTSAALVAVTNSEKTLKLLSPNQSQTTSSIVEKSTILENES